MSEPHVYSWDSSMKMNSLRFPDRQGVYPNLCRCGASNTRVVNEATLAAKVPTAFLFPQQHRRCAVIYRPQTNAVTTTSAYRELSAT